MKLDDSQSSMFDFPETEPEKHKGTGQTCGNCAYGARLHRYREDWIYCTETPCNRSQFGVKKVKSRQEACHKFVEK